jgi:hypothetical protein
MSKNQTDMILEHQGENEMNCHECKWLDQAKQMPKGAGYCSMVERSKKYKFGDRVRYVNSERCEFYEKGIFEKRFEK